MTTALLILALFIAGNFGRIYYQNAQAPSLGVEQGQFQPISKKPNNVSTQTDDADKKVEPLTAKETPAATLTAIKQAINLYGGADIQRETDDYLYVVFTTGKMRFHDDAEFWLDSASQQVQFRSASRAGYSDMGRNRQRYERIAELYAAQ
ncbi:DUF1499 domain-containing protein [Reinekea sp.]|jgi:uncharacterized protein (DUF1499 family)|uniref:DUF1499 domain-containing protein n=1 Tax=Reinekea sp. TaxID=1970455 RepID=UPI002A826FF3|nr:DUF1499 domain-containing protein [Reinekea sp.]